MNFRSNRLQFRELTFADSEAVFSYRSDPSVKKYDTLTPNTKSEILEIIEKSLAWQRAVPRPIFFGAIVLSDDRRFVGEFMCTAPDDNGTSEIGFMLSQNQWGQGYGTEVVETMGIAAVSDDDSDGT